MIKKSQIHFMAVSALMLFALMSVIDVHGAEIKIPDYGISAEDYFGHAVAISGNYAITGAYKSDADSPDSGAAYILKYDNNNWIQAEKLTPGDAGIPHGYFGYSVSISGNYAIVGAFNNDGNESGSGAAYIFKNTNSSWTLQAAIKADDGKKNDYFGYSVCISGDLAIIGAYRDSHKGKDSGSAYIFKNNNGVWTQQSKITASDGAAGDKFGRSVAISGDYAVVGAVHDGDKGSNSGSAYIFKYNGTNWSQTDKLTANDGSANDFFGFCVSISGNYAIIGASLDDDNGINSGSAYIFKYNGTNWSQADKLTANDGSANDFFGKSVCISGDYAVVGADSDDDNGENSGAAYIFKNNGAAWVQYKKHIPKDSTVQDNFGCSVGISQQGSSYYFIAGSDLDDDNGNNSGSVYLYGDFPVGSPKIQVTPQELILDQGVARSRISDDKARNIDDKETYATGLIIPEYVKEYWKNHGQPPPRMSANLPASKDWSAFDSPVKSQQSCGSCAVFAAVALVENLGNQANLPVAQDLSEQTVLSCSPDLNCYGGWYSDALNYIKNYGIPPESCYPYINSKGSCTDKCSEPEFFEKIGYCSNSPGLWGEDHTKDNLRIALQDGPVCVSMRVPDDGTFRGNGYQGGIYDYNGGTIEWASSAHAVLLVGYDDNLQCFKVKNSWGKDWGENGYFRIAYDDVTDDVKFGSYGVTASDVYLASRTSTFIIANQGSANLVINNMYSDNDWLSFLPSFPLTILPNQQQVISVSVNNWDNVNVPEETGYINISSNDIDVKVSVIAKRSTGMPDFQINLSDAVLILQILTGIENGINSLRVDEIKSNININNDKTLGLEEVIYILKYVAGNN